jgi:hypothetical protein
MLFSARAWSDVLMYPAFDHNVPNENDVVSRERASRLSVFYCCCCRQSCDCLLWLRGPASAHPSEMSTLVFHDASSSSLRAVTNAWYSDWVSVRVSLSGPHGLLQQRPCVMRSPQSLCHCRSLKAVQASSPRPTHSMLAPSNNDRSPQQCSACMKTGAHG